MSKQARSPKASPRKTCRSDSDPFLDGLNAQDFSQQSEPVSVPAPDPYDWERAAMGTVSPPVYEIVHERGTTPADTETAAMGILRCAARAQLGVWYLLNRANKQWRRARWTINGSLLVYRIEEIKNGRIEFYSQEGIEESDDIGI